MDVCGAEDYRERDASLVCHNMALRARLSLIRRIRAGSLSPLFADTLAESRETLSQSIRSASPRRSRSTRCSASHTPASCQSRKCRQHVEPDPQPISPWGASPRGCAALQDEDDASEGRAIVDTRSAALWFGWLFGQQRLDRIPQFVRYQFFAHINERNICSQAGFARCSKVPADDPVWVRSSWYLIYSHMVI